MNTLKRKIKRFFCNHDYEKVYTLWNNKGIVAYYYECTKCGKYMVETYVGQINDKVVR